MNPQNKQTRDLPPWIRNKDKSKADIARDLQEQQYILRYKIWYFVRKYLIYSGLAILAIVAASMISRQFSDKKIIDTQSISILISGAFGQLVGVLYLITNRVFKND